MMTDTLAQSILAHDDPRGALATAQDVAGFKQMARLWLLLPEIREALDAEAVSACYIPLFDKITAIAGEGEDGE